MAFDEKPAMNSHVGRHIPLDTRLKPVFDIRERQLPLFVPKTGACG